ncbi:MAG: hypothetical protein ACRDUV_08680 [Pseudonocardiaceae bacterium]
MAAVSGALSTLVNALQGFPLILTATVVVPLVLLTMALQLMNALNERYVTRKITTEEGALNALRILRPAPPTDDRTPKPADPEGPTGPGAGRPSEPSP